MSEVRRIIDLKRAVRVRGEFYPAKQYMVPEELDEGLASWFINKGMAEEVAVEIIEPERKAEEPKPAPKEKIGLGGGTMTYRSGLRRKSEAQELASIRLAKRGVRSESKRGAEALTGVHEPEELIRFALERHERVAVSWSGGRCSTAVLHMALKLRPDILVFHTDHGVHYPETRSYVEELAGKWNLNLVVARPERTFWQVVEEHGFPFIRKPYGGYGKPACCYWLKEKPVVDFRKNHNVDAFLTGCRVGESRVRMFSAATVGQYYYTTKYGLNAWRYHPIAFWTTRQVTEYCVSEGIPLNPLYKKGLDRVGCWPCTSFTLWYRDLARVKPKLCEFLLRKMGNKRLLDHFYQTRIAPCMERR